MTVPPMPEHGKAPSAALTERRHRLERFIAALTIFAEQRRVALVNLVLADEYHVVPRLDLGRRPIEESRIESPGDVDGPCRALLVDPTLHPTSRVRRHDVVARVERRVAAVPHLGLVVWVIGDRANTRTAHVPMLILTARTDAKAVVTGFETGADDYIAKPFDITELLARVKSHLRRSAQRPVLNPLTGLPGGVLLSQAIRRCLARKTPFALLYADLY